MADYVLPMSEGEVARYRFMAERAKQTELDDWAAAGFVPGATVADVGCGPAALSVVLADVVGPTGHVHAIERDRDALGQARAMTADLPSVTVHEGEATAVPVANLDAVMMRHVLAHNGGREQEIVDHLVDRVAPGGWVYVVDVDLRASRSLGVDPAATDFTERYAEFHRSIGNDPQVGLRLGQLLRRAGLSEVAHRGQWSIFDTPAGLRPPSWAARDAMLAAGAVTVEQIEACAKAMEQMDALVERPTMFLATFTAWGRRPS